MISTRRSSSFGSFVVALMASLLFGACNGSSAGDPASAAPVDGDAGADASVPPPPDAASPPACPAGVEFTTLSGKIIVPVSLNGGAPKSWIFDTGAPITVIDKALASQYPGKVTVSVGGISRPVQLTPFDVTSRFPGVYGIVGQDVFGEVLTIDYPRKRLWIVDALNEADLLACDHVNRAPATVDVEIGDYIFTKGTMEGTAGSFVVDSGASYGASNKSIFAALDKAHPRPSIGGFYTPASAGTFWARATTIGYMEVGGQRVGHLFSRTIDDNILPTPTTLGTAALLGVLPSGFLHHFMLTIDFAGKKMRLDAAKGDPLVEPTTFYVVGIGLEETMTAPVHVTDVLPGSSAAQAGIVVGDEVVSINQLAVGSIAAASRAFDLAGPTAGASVTVTTSHAGGAATDHVLVMQDLLTSPSGLP